MSKKIATKGGPLEGKTFLVHDRQKTFTHHAAPAGHYKVNEKTATWKPDTDEPTTDDTDNTQTDA